MDRVHPHKAPELRGALSLGTAWLQRAVLDRLLADAYQWAPQETGGLLLGYRHGPREIVITDAVAAGPDAEHRQDGFTPDGDWQRAELARRYQEAGRRLQYLGDWHTHPGGSTILSRTDRRTLTAIARHRAARCPQPVMGVLAGGDPWILAVRQHTPRVMGRGSLDELTVRLY